MLRWFLFCLMISGSVDSARILSVVTIPAKSHNILFEAILKTLAQRGHQVVSYTPFPLAEPVANYTVNQIDVTAEFNKLMTMDKFEAMMDISPIALTSSMWGEMLLLFEQFSKNEKMTELFHSNEKYDLVILEALFTQEALLGLGHKFNAPVVAVLPLGAYVLANKLAGNTLSLSYIPDVAFPYSDHMTFYERMLNAYSKLLTLYKYYTEHLQLTEKLMRKMFNDPTMPPLVDMVHKISLFVNNAHPTIHYAQPYTPNIITIGGIHLVKETKPLPRALKKFLDEAKHGVIYFSLGSMVPDHMMPQKYFDNFLSVFRRLPQRVVWKTGAELSNLPDNVMTVKWAPQQDILAHPNIVLFMTHGGVFSQHEAINAGVPVVCTPFVGDQRLNTRFYEERGIGVELPFKSLSQETIYKAVNTVLTTPKYKDNMRRLSAIYKDRHMSPADSLVFWVEYVLRHRGAHHLRPASSTMSWYQLALLDVIVVVVTILSLILVLFYFSLRKITSFFWNKNTSTIKSKKTN